MSWERAIEFILQWEGGYVNDPQDPGGETKYGISKRAHPTVDIQALDRTQAEAIYKEKYWDAMGCGHLTDPLDIVVFDSAVNCGKVRTGTWLKVSSGKWQDLVELRRLHYEKLNNFQTPDGKHPYARFYRGWTNRLLALHTLAAFRTHE